MLAMDDRIEQMREMVARLNAAADAYYNGRGELMTDFEWDALFDQVKELESETGVVLPDSPTSASVIKQMSPVLLLTFRKKESWNLTAVPGTGQPRNSPPWGGRLPRRSGRAPQSPSTWPGRVLQKKCARICTTASISLPLTCAVFVKRD